MLKPSPEKSSFREFTVALGIDLNRQQVESHGDSFSLSRQDPRR